MCVAIAVLITGQCLNGLRNSANCMQIAPKTQNKNTFHAARCRSTVENHLSIQCLHHVWNNILARFVIPQHNTPKCCNCKAKKTGIISERFVYCIGKSKFISDECVNASRRRPAAAWCALMLVVIIERRKNSADIRVDFV